VYIEYKDIAPTLDPGDPLRAREPRRISPRRRRSRARPLSAQRRNRRRCERARRRIRCEWRRRLRCEGALSRRGVAHRRAGRRAAAGRDEPSTAG